MQCLFLFRDAAGRLPTAQELRRCGFIVSNAALPPDEAAGGATGPALAAERHSSYGSPRPLCPAEDLLDNGAS